MRHVHMKCSCIAHSFSFWSFETSNSDSMTYFFQCVYSLVYSCTAHDHFYLAFRDMDQLAVLYAYFR